MSEIDNYKWISTPDDQVRVHAGKPWTRFERCAWSHEKSSARVNFDWRDMQLEIGNFQQAAMHHVLAMNMLFLGTRRRPGNNAIADSFDHRVQRMAEFFRKRSLEGST